MNKLQTRNTRNDSWRAIINIFTVFWVFLLNKLKFFFSLDPVEDFIIMYPRMEVKAVALKKKLSQWRQHQFSWVETSWVRSQNRVATII